MKSEAAEAPQTIAGRWDLIPSEMIDILFDAGIPRDISCDLIESLPEDLWPQIQLSTISADPNSAKLCNAITVVLAYLMQHDFKLAVDIDVQMGSAFQFLQGKIAEQRINGRSEVIDSIRLRLDTVINEFFSEYYDKEKKEPHYRAANQAIH